jgi:hypothetical protein
VGVWEGLQLELEGVGEDATGEGTITDPELLMEVMELRQAVEDTSDPHELARLASFNQDQEAKCVKVTPPPPRADTNVLKGLCSVHVVVYENESSLRQPSHI